MTIRSFALFALCLNLAVLAVAETRSFEASVIGAGRPMILIPGLGCPGDVWSDSVAELSKKRQCHTLSLGGFAGRPAFDFRHGFVDSVVRDLAAYIAEQKLDRPALVGHSLGGFIALKFSIDHPGLAGPIIIVDSLPFLPAAMDPAATVESAKRQADTTRQTLAQVGMDPHLATQMLASMITAPERIDQAAQWSLASDPATVAQAMYELQTTDLREDVSRIQSPTLVLGSWIAYQHFGATRDSTAAIFDRQYHALPDYTLAMSDHGKHFIMWDDPVFFLRQIEDFLAFH